MSPNIQNLNNKESHSSAIKSSFTFRIAKVCQHPLRTIQNKLVLCRKCRKISVERNNIAKFVFNN